VVTVTLNPAIDQTLSIPGFAANQVNRVAASRSDAGGKGVNVASVLADFGVGVIATGFLGADDPELFENLFVRKGIEGRFVRIAGSTRIGIKIVDDRTGQTTDINFPGLAPRAEEVEELVARVAGLAEPGGWFVISGSVPPGVPSGLYVRLIQEIHGRGGWVVLDTSGPPLREALAAGPEVVKPNLQELSELAGRDLDTPAAVEAAAEPLFEQGVRRVVISMGGDGALFLERGPLGEHALRARPPRVDVRSTVGAGDAMVAGLVAATIWGLPLEEVARMGTAAGAYAVTQAGAGIGDWTEFERLRSAVEIETGI
jgi:1-phosphofructokinase family hexose kinase